MNKAYVDTSNAVNNRTISIFPTTRPAINGESWFITNNQRQQAFRQVYTFTTTAAITHNITNVVPGQFIRAFGEFIDTTTMNTYGLIYGAVFPIPGQLSFYITTTQIILVPGAGAPTLKSGVVVLEWLARP